MINSVNAATYYVSPIGSDLNDGSYGNPWRTFAHAFSLMASMDTLIARNGNYNEDVGTWHWSGGVMVPDSYPPSGTPMQKTRVMGESVGGVIVNGGLNIIQWSNVLVEAFTFLGGGTISGSSYIDVKASGFKGGIGTSSSSYITKEDVWAWGDNRYVISNYQSDHIIDNRVIARLDDIGTPDALPVGAISHYLTDYSIIANALLFDVTGTFNQPFDLVYSSRPAIGFNKLYGIIGFNAGSQLGGIFPGDGGGGGHQVINSVIWGTQRGVRFNSPGPNLVSNSTIANNVGQAVSQWSDITLNNNIFSDNGGIGGAITSCNNNLFHNSGSLGSCTNSDITTVPNIMYLPRSPISGKGANIEKRYDITLVGNEYVVTENLQDLWPWPYEDIIRRDMCAESTYGWCSTSKTLTKYIWEYLGNPCPPEICLSGPSNCGNGVIDVGEQCDNGASNGVLCTPSYGSSCTYCSLACNIVNLTGAFCGDGTCNPEETSVSCPSDCPAVNVCTPSNVKCVDDTPGAYQEYSTIQLAANAAVPGDSVLVFAGNYAGFQVATSSTSISPITFKANDSNVIINSDGPTGDGIRLQNVNYIALEGFDIRNPSQRCIAARGATSTSPMIGNIIRKNKCSNSGTEGFYLSQLNKALIESNNITNAGNGVIGFSLHGLYLANAGSDDTVLRDNIVSGTGGEGMHFNGDIFQGGDGIITGLLIERNRISGTADNGFSMDGVRDSMIRNNLVYNVGKSDARAYQIDGAQGPYNLSFVNNILLSGSAGWPIKISASAGSHKFFNNILLSPNGALNIDNIDFVSNYNAVSDGFSSNGEISVVNLASWKTQGYDLNSFIASGSGLFVNPLSNDYHHLASSPAIDAGISILNGILAPAIDFDGNARPQSLGYDIGAYEFQGVLPSPSTCQLTSALWSTTSTTEGNVVSLNVQGTDCDNKQISFVVWEDDLIGDDPVITNPVNAVFSGNTATGSWIAEWQDDALTDPEYYFIAALTTNLTETITSSNQLSVSKGAVSSTCPSYALDGNK